MPTGKTNESNAIKISYAYYDWRCVLIAFNILNYCYQALKAAIKMSQFCKRIQPTLRIVFNPWISSTHGRRLARFCTWLRFSIRQRNESIILLFLLCNGWNYYDYYLIFFSFLVFICAMGDVCVVHHITTDWKITLRHHPIGTKLCEKRVCDMINIVNL